MCPLQMHSFQLTKRATQFTQCSGGVSENVYLISESEPNIVVLLALPCLVVVVEELVYPYKQGPINLRKKMFVEKFDCDMLF